MNQAVKAPRIEGARFTLVDWLGRVPQAGVRSLPVFEHGTMLAKLYAPRGNDPQKPHTRDEVYVVVRGRGTFVYGSQRTVFEPGDFLFVPAGVDHRFEDFSGDLALWVVFYGPQGGEQA